MGLGKRIAEVLKEKGITVSELSKRTDIPATTLYSLIKRDSNSFNAINIAKISEALEIPMFSLLGWQSEDEMNYYAEKLEDFELNQILGICSAIFKHANYDIDTSEVGFLTITLPDDALRLSYDDLHVLYQSIESFAKFKLNEFKSK